MDINIATVDFETEAIEEDSNGAPKPVGVSIKIDNERSTYYAFGHPTNNNTTEAVAHQQLDIVRRHTKKIVFHNAKFDVAVWKQYYGFSQYDKVEDTLFLAFLKDPREATLSLKPLADKYLDMPPDEQTELKEWLILNVKKATERNYGKYICLAPGDLVGKYAAGDTDRTYALYLFFTDRLFS